MQDGKYKIAQYSQWDGYREGQGGTVYDFCIKYSIEQMKAAKAYFLSESEIEAVNKDFQPEGKHSHLSRDAGATVLFSMMDGDNVGFINCMSHESEEALVEDLGAWIEYSYVIDLDSEELKVFNGLPIGDAADKYSLKSMPTKAQFLSDEETED